MNLIDHLAFFTFWDGTALALLAIAALAIGHVIENPRRGQPSVSVLMATYRRDWMRAHVTRQPRIYDATILANLRQGTTFFASTSLLAIGGGLALIGNTERLAAVAEDLTLSGGPALIWEVKILAVILFLANAFFKFIWAFRLYGYASVVMASAPNDESDLAYFRSAQAGDIIEYATRSFNRGLRAVYFALAAGAWLAGALPLMMATAVAVVILWRREFASRSRAALLRDAQAEHDKAAPTQT